MSLSGMSKEELALLKKKGADQVHLGGGREFTTRAQQKDQLNAKAFYEKKLDGAPGNAWYNHMLAALAVNRGDNDAATGYFRQSVANSNNVMTRNDLALHMARTENLRDPDKFRDALTEMKKAQIIAGKDNAVLQKNLGALYAAHGDYIQARDHTRRALEINPDDASLHRNMSQLMDSLGDRHSALKHNIEAMGLDQKQHKKGVPNSYRRAAVQNMCKGGKISESVDLIRTARQQEGKKYICPTSQKTAEIVAKIMKRSGDPIAEMQKEQREWEEKKAVEDRIKSGNIDAIKPSTKRSGKYTREAHDLD